MKLQEGDRVKNEEGHSKPVHTASGDRMTKILRTYGGCQYEKRHV